MSVSQVAELRSLYELQTAAEPAFRASFDLLATAPQGVAKLRELILLLAVQGKLLPQNPKDEPASESLARIGVAKDRLVADGEIKQNKAAGAIAKADRIFDLPAGWEWARLADLTSILNGRAYAKDELLSAGVPVLRVGNLFTSNHWYYSNLTLEPGKYCDVGDLLFAWSASFGPFIWPGPKAIYHYHIWKLDLHRASDLNKNYLYTFLLKKTQEIKAAGHGVSMLHMTKEKMEKIVVPIPPLAEQARIVARVEELMQLCDALEAHGRLQDEQHARLVATLFDALAASESADALAGNWQRIATHFDLLLDRPEAVDTFEQTLLQLAVRGLLVPQDPNDEPASALLQKIQTCREDLRWKAGNSKHTASSDEPSFNLPRGWEAIGLLDVCAVGGGATPSKGNPSYWDGNFPWVSPKDMKVDRIEDSQDHVSSKALAETRLPLVAKNSLLVVVRGMILVHSFPVAVTAREVTLNQDMKSFTPYIDRLTDFLALALKGFKPEILALVARSTHGTCKLESEKLFGFKFGLPPMAEQHRILARVEELRRLCANLRERLQQSRATQSHLADALVSTAAQSPKC
jgi:type I restriction enzyme S subunit